MAISSVKRRLKVSSSCLASVGPIGASGLPAGPCTASIAELATMTTKTAVSNRGCSHTHIAPIRSG